MSSRRLLPVLALLALLATVVCGVKTGGRCERALQCEAEGVVCILGTCALPSKEGGKCQLNDHCDGEGVVLSCVVGVCKVPGPIGAVCDSPLDCAGLGVCDEGVCKDRRDVVVPQQTPYAGPMEKSRAIGSYCDGSGDCDGDILEGNDKVVCILNRCQKLSQAGQR